jgi:hypothetical protein
MGQEFVIKSQAIEDKVNQLLPSQGGFQAGVDFSASTTIIPIVDLTETAEGSALRQDLQKALSFATATTFSVDNTTSTIINTTGTWRITATANAKPNNSSAVTNRIIINDGSSTKDVYVINYLTNSNTSQLTTPIDLLVKLEAGESLEIRADGGCVFSGSVRQIADLSGNLVNP